MARVAEMQSESPCFGFITAFFVGVVFHRRFTKSLLDLILGRGFRHA